MVRPVLHWVRSFWDARHCEIAIGVGRRHGDHLLQAAKCGVGCESPGFSSECLLSQNFLYLCAVSSGDGWSRVSPSCWIALGCSPFGFDGCRTWLKSLLGYFLRYSNPGAEHWKTPFPFPPRASVSHCLLVAMPTSSRRTHLRLSF